MPRTTDRAREEGDDSSFARGLRVLRAVAERPGARAETLAAALEMPVLKITDEWFFVSGIDVLASRETGCVVALGEHASGLLANDIDADGNPLSVSLVQGPSSGSLQLNADGSFIATGPGTACPAALSPAPPPGATSILPWKTPRLRPRA